MQEPRDPLLKVLFLFSEFYQTFTHKIFIDRILPPVEELPLVEATG
jgi:hypothetical protein